MSDGHADEPDIDLIGGLQDYVLPFQLGGAGARGRMVRLSGAVDEILTKHDYPDAVSAILGEAVTLAGLLGAALKFDGKFILQTATDGPVSLVVAQYDAPGALRGYASFDAEALPKAGGGRAPSGLLGDGHLAMTIDQGAGMERYQGLVALAGAELLDAAHLYFRQSEQIPTLIRIAVARGYTAPSAGEAHGRLRWHAGGLMVQKMPGEGGSAVPPEDGLAGDGEDWTRVATLAGTVEDHELLDPTLPPERLLYRLFHEEGVRGFAAQPLAAHCTCSSERVGTVLRQFSADELAGMVEDGTITATCEFCNSVYRFAPDELAS